MHFLISPKTFMWIFKDTNIYLNLEKARKLFKGFLDGEETDAKTKAICL